MSQVSRREVIQIQRNIENVVGVLMKIKNSDYNETEKLSLFITCSRVLGRVGLWCTTLNHNYLHMFLWRCSYGYYLDLDTSIEYLLKYSIAFLNEIEIMSDRVLGHSDVRSEDDEDYETDDRELESVGEEDF